MSAVLQLVFVFVGAWPIFGDQGFDELVTEGQFRIKCEERVCRKCDVQFITQYQFNF